MNKINLNKVKLNFVSLNKVGEILSKVREIVQEFWQQVTLRGVNKLRIDDMKYNSISSLAVYGAMEQLSTPTENTPVYPVYLGGKYRVSWNLPSGYARVEGVSMSADTYYQITGFRLKGEDYLEISFTPNKACNLIGCYTTTNATDNYSIYLTTTNNGKYLRYADGAYNSYVEVGKRYDVKVSPYGCSSFAEYSSWSKKDFTTSVDLLIGNTSVDATSSKFDGIIHGEIKVGSYSGGSNRLHLIPCERISDGVVGYYDIRGKKFYEPTVGAGAMTGYDGSKTYITMDTSYCEEEFRVVNADKENVIYSRVAPYYDELRSLGDIAESYDIVSGVVTKKIDYRKLTGDETFGSSTAYGKALYLNGQATKWGADKTKAVMCSHFVGLPPASSTQAEGTCFFNSSGHLYFRTNMTTDEFKVYLKKQAAIGKPVYVWYVSTTETTEQVSGQKLLNLKGDCTIKRVLYSIGIDSYYPNSDIADITFDVTCEVKTTTPPPEPEEPDSGVIEYHFEVPMHLEHSLGFPGEAPESIGTMVTACGTVEGDFTELLNKLKALSNEYEGKLTEDIILERTNITVNGYRMTDVYYYDESHSWNGEAYADMLNPHLENNGNCLNGIVIYPTYVSMEMYSMLFPNYPNWK